MRAGTENVAGIVGLVKALEIAYTNLDIYQKHIDNLKRCCIDRLKSNIPNMKFNGNSAIADKSIYTILSAGFPSTETDLLMNLDFNGISASGGCVCIVLLIQPLMY